MARGFTPWRIDRVLAIYGPAPAAGNFDREPAALRLRDRRRLDGVSADQLILHVAGLVTPRLAGPGFR